MGKLSILLAVASFGFCLWWRLKDNYIKIASGVKIDHKKEVAYRAPFLLFAAVMLAAPVGWAALAVSIPMTVLAWWLLFDGLLGLRRKRGFWDVGTEDDEDDAESDNLLQRLTPVERKVLKTVPLAILLLTYLAWLIK